MTPTIWMRLAHWFNYILNLQKKPVKVQNGAIRCNSVYFFGKSKKIYVCPDFNSHAREKSENEKHADPILRRGRENERTRDGWTRRGEQKRETDGKGGEN